MDAEHENQHSRCRAGDSPKLSTVRGGFQGVDQEFLYDLVSVPQVNLHNKTTGVMIGKAVGGSSAVNAMMTVRGTAEDYDRWGNFFSNSSEWSWKGMLPYFKKALSFQAPDAAVAKAANMTFDASFWGNTSGVTAGWPSFQYPASKAQINAYREIPGVEFPPDSGAGRPGVYWYPTFMTRGPWSARTREPATTATTIGRTTTSSLVPRSPRLSSMGQRQPA